MTKTIAILMTSYNGANYIKKQIDSILEQDYNNWELYIRDDGSTDGTLDIIRDFSATETRIKIVENNSSYHGAFVNFHYLVNHLRTQKPYDYYFFADQDDIWLPDKLSTALAAFTDNSRPQMIYTDMEIIDEKDKLLKNSFHAEKDLTISNKKLLFFTFNTYVWGCTTAFNRTLLDLIPEVAVDEDIDLVKFLSHDKLFAEFALYFGDLIFLEKPSLKYRRHSTNTTEMSDGKIKGRHYLALIKNGIDQKYQAHASLYNQTLYFLKLVREKGLMTDNLESMENAIRIGGGTGLKYLRQHGIKKNHLSQNLALYLILFSKGYQKYIIV